MFTIKRTAEFDAWFAGIRDGVTKRRLVARLRKRQLGNLGDVKALSDGVFENANTSARVDGSTTRSAAES
jgi:putative addiction module killer protein